MKYPLTVVLMLCGYCTNSFAADEEADWGVWATEIIDFSEQHQDVVDEAVEESGIGAMVDPVEPAKDTQEVRMALGDKISAFAAIRGMVAVDVAEIAEITDKGSADAVYGSGISGSDENLLHELDKSSLLDYESRTDHNSLSAAAESREVGVSPQVVGSEFEGVDLLEEVGD